MRWNDAMREGGRIRGLILRNCWWEVVRGGLKGGKHVREWGERGLREKVAVPKGEKVAVPKVKLELPSTPHAHLSRTMLY